MKDWAGWHEDYDRPGSSLARRLTVVQARLRTALATTGPSPVILSLCSGDSRDVIGVLSSFPGPVERAVLVENDVALADRAGSAASEQGLHQVEVRCEDAGAVASFVDVIPVEVLLLCGIFGNIEHRSARSVIEVVPNLVKTGGCVIWTRGASLPDRRAEIREWFVGLGLEEIAFDGDPEPFGVGFNRVTRAARPAAELPERMLTFVR